MSNTFLRKVSSNVSLTETAVGNYTVGSNVGAVIVGLSVSNTNLSQVYANVLINNGIAGHHIIKNGTIPAQGALILVGGSQKIILQEGDSIRVSASANVDAIMTVMESTSVGLTNDGGEVLEGDLLTLTGSVDLMAETGTEDLNA